MADTFKVNNFQPNAFITVEGKKADTFFIIRQGKVRLHLEMPVPDEEPNQILGPGDFFGVVSAMSTHPHIETVQTLEATSLICVARDQFGMMIQRNASIAMKIIRYFSWRLRMISKAIAKLTFKAKATEDNLQQIFDVAEFYFQRQENGHAAYAFQRYLEYFPSGKHRDTAKRRLQDINAPSTVPKNTEENLSRIFKDGQLIFIEHEPGSELHIIQQGRVKITKIVDQNEVLLAVLQPGDILGEMALLENEPRSASATAHGEVSTLVINKANFETIVKRQPDLAVKLITLLSKRIWTAYRQLSNLLISDPIGRVYDMLLTLVQKGNGSIDAKASYFFDIGSAELIEMLGFESQKGNEYIDSLLEDQNFRIDQEKIVCLSTLDLEKKVQLYRKKSLIQRKREESQSS